MYEQVKKQKENKSKPLAKTTIQKKSNGKKSHGFVDNRPEAVVQKKLQELANKSVQENRTTQLKSMTHSKGCGCSSCSPQIVQRKEQVKRGSGDLVAQLMQCGECLEHNGHKSTCSKKKPPKKGKAPKRGNGTHKLGGSHDDGSGYQRNRSGGDRHEKGRRAAQKAKERKQKKKR